MAHKIAKLILERAPTPEARVEAVKTALQMGMPLNQIEEYLDWLDMMRGENHPQSGSSEQESDTSN